MSFRRFLALTVIATQTNVALALSIDSVKLLCSQFENNTIVIGMVTKGNTELTLARWRPTFETYLTSEIEKYGCRTRLVPLQFDTYETATRNKTIDLIFPNPTAFQEMKDKYGVHEFVSVKRNFGEDQELDRFGGVIVRAAGRFTDMITVADMAKHPGITICGVNPNAFGGWHVQIYEMLQAGLDVTADYDVQFLGKHENCMLETVKTFSCDVGVARTETIERLVLTNQMNASDVFVLSERSAEYNFPQALSTILYPEWPLASLAHVPRDLEQLIALPLLSLAADSDEAIAGDHAGFSFPYSYEPVRRILIAIDHYKTGECEPGYFRRGTNPGVCIECAPGTHSPDGLGECDPCPIGTVNNGTANTDCFFCPSGYTTEFEGSVSGQCIVEPEPDPDLTPLYITIFTPLGLMLVSLIASGLYLRIRLGRPLTNHEIFDHLLVMVKTAGKVAYGCVDLITDLIVIRGVLVEDQGSGFYYPYALCGVLSIAASLLDLAIAVRSSKTSLSWIQGNRARTKVKAAKGLEKQMYKSMSSRQMMKSLSEAGVLDKSHNSGEGSPSPSPDATRSASRVPSTNTMLTASVDLESRKMLQPPSYQDGSPETPGPKPTDDRQTLTSPKPSFVGVAPGMGEPRRSRIAIIDPKKDHASKEKQWTGREKVAPAPMTADSRSTSAISFADDPCKKTRPALLHRKDSDNSLTSSHQQIAEQLTESELWEYEVARMQMIDMFAAALLVFCEDLPMILLNTLYVALEVSNDCSKLPGGLITFMLSYAASCCFAGLRFHSVVSICAQYSKISKVADALVNTVV
uniref:Tyrosine-protein kinase ephrin type A/B receptor-like domain-containing protein n=1 Tax=Chrysotila carterae TaxID=13221 RepID=A0A7S4BYK1_CHRCT